MPRIALPSTSINYELTGSGTAWLVLLHEIGGTLWTWNAVARTLGTRFRVLAYDQRGSGQSDRISGAFTLGTQIDDLADLLSALGAPEALHLAGNALGAAFAVRFAARHPQRVRSLVLACLAPNVNADRIRYLQERAAAVEREGMQATVESSLGNSYPAEAIRDRAVYERYRERFLANDPKSYAAVNRAFAQFDVTGDLAAIRCPTLVLAGRHDKLRPPAYVRDLAARIPEARYEVIDSGHIMPVQAPDEMLAAMMKFYADYP
ncbi:MAG TPA: alpha/beta hydrolase [Pseudolabrys sp.]|nr:alpha/beta hydrolase [Pseudolabrys sp.]